MRFYAIAFIVSYLIGSLPTAYIVVKRKARIDIRSAGSGNVGTLNAYEVTGKRHVGLLVLLIDVAKGAAAVVVAGLLARSAPEAVTLAPIGVVVGHCFPVWLKFRGGRGLAPTAGAMLVAGAMIVVLWLASWGVSYLVSKNIHVSNVVAIVAAALLGYLVPEGIMQKTMLTGYSVPQLLIVYSSLSVVLLLKHLEPIKALIVSKTRMKN